MKAISKYLAGAAAAATLAVAGAAPAQAQSYDRHGHYDYRDRGRGIDTGDIITGVAILGGIAAIAAALDRDGSRYGYRDRYRYGYQAAVNSCGYEAQRYARYGQVRITDVDRVRRNQYRVRGVIETADRGGYDGYGRYGRYDRYDRAYSYDRHDRYDRRGYDRYGRYDRYRDYDRDRFTCYAWDNGRIRDFDVRG